MNDLEEATFKTINQHIEDKGMLMKRGTLVETTIIADPGSTKNRSASKIQRRVQPERESSITLA